MPLYEYECNECNERFDRLVSASNRNEGGECPRCWSESTERVPSTFAVGKPSISGPICCPD